MKQHNTERHSTHTRLLEIERLLYWRGRLNRGDLIDRFGISKPQASADIKRYLTINGLHVNYDARQACYLVEDGFAPVLDDLGPDDFRIWSRAETESPERIEDLDGLFPKREADAAMLARVTRALYAGDSLEIRYQSLSSPEPEKRRITPHAVVFVQGRPHVRAWCSLRQDFRDFVVGRIIEAGAQAEPEGPGAAADAAWHIRLPVRVVPDPRLSPDQQKVIEQEYGLDGGGRVIPVRAALLIYFLSALRCDGLEDQRDPAAQQIIISNKAEVLEMAGAV